MTEEDTRDYIVFNNIDSRTYSAYIFNDSTDNAPVFEYETEQIPGRNGDLILNRNRRPNVQHTYNVIIESDIDTNFPAFKSALLNVDGYAKLEDSFHSGEFYLAYLSDNIEPRLTRQRDAVKFSLVFNRKPQRFLDTGETVTTLTATGTISNPTSLNSKPLLRVYGTGTLGIGNYSLTISTANGYTDIDCDMMECYKDTYATNCNANVTFANYAFPQLLPGTNAVSLGTGITKVEITPRWYVL